MIIIMFIVHDHHDHYDNIHSIMMMMVMMRIAVALQSGRLSPTYADTTHAPPSKKIHIVMMMILILMMLMILIVIVLMAITVLMAHPLYTSWLAHFYADEAAALQLSTFPALHFFSFSCCPGMAADFFRFTATNLCLRTCHIS